MSENHKRKKTLHCRSKTYKIIRILLVLLLPLLGCALGTPSVLKDKSAPSPYGTGFEKFAWIKDVDGVFNAIAHIEVNSGDRKNRLKVAIMLKQPSLMRIETIFPIGPPDFFLSMTQDTLKVFVPSERKFYQGHASRENLALFFPLSMSPESIVCNLMGIPPGITGKDLKFIEEEQAENGKHQLYVFSSDGKKIMKLMVYEQNNRLEGMDVFSSCGNILYTTSYDDYSEVGKGRYLPRKITVFSPETNLTVSIRYSDIELREEMDETIFDLAIPPGVVPIFINAKDMPEKEDE